MVYNQKRKSYTIKHKLSVVKDFETSYLNGDAKSKLESPESTTFLQRCKKIGLTKKNHLLQC